MALFSSSASTLSSGISVNKDLKVSNEEFTQLRDFIYEQSGIFIA